MSKFIHILVADDDSEDHQFFLDALRRTKVAGFNANEVVSVRSVYHGGELIEYLNKNRFLQLPDFIVLDLNMPVKDGFEVLRELSAQPDFKHIPVYVLSTSNKPEHRQKCIELGCAGFFSKPPKLAELKQVLEKMLYAMPEA